MIKLPNVKITPKAEKTLKGGHVWVYADEVTSVPELCPDGGLVHVYSQSNKWLGTGFYNSKSTIRVRIISKNPNDLFDKAFWERRVRWSIDYRRSVMPGDDFKCCRLIFGESDSFPGLTVDRFDDILVIESLCLGIDLLKDTIYPLIVKVLRDEYGQTVTSIYERCDSQIRTLEGMVKFNGFYHCDGLSEEKPIAEIVENGIKYTVDCVNGQKTGFFLDQKYNRQAIRPIANSRRVLDCFTHTGSFGLNAAAAGATHVVSVDISGEALEMAAKNAESNGFSDKIEYIKADAFDYLNELLESGKKDFDFIILDPPAFTKSRSTLKNAIEGYRKINAIAMKLLPRGGYLATCSCSHFMTETYFKQMLHNAAEDASVALRQIEARQQAPDHPILWNVPETSYLKFYIFQVI